MICISLISLQCFTASIQHSTAWNHNHLNKDNCQGHMFKGNVHCNYIRLHFVQSQNISP